MLRGVMRSRLFALGVGAAALFVVRVGRADLARYADVHAIHGSVDLVYDRAVPECPDTVRLRDEIAARLGYVPFVSSPEEADVRIEVRIVRQAGGLLQATIIRTGTGRKAVASGSRTLSSGASDCTELAGALVLATALAIDPMAVTSAAPPPVEAIGPSIVPSRALADENVAEPGVPPPLRPAAQKEENVAARPGPPALTVAHRLQAGIGVAGGVVPGIAMGPLVRYEAGLTERVSLGVELRADVPVGGARAEGPRGSVDARLFRGSISPCWGSALLAACATVSAGAIHGRGFDIDVPHAVWSAWVAAGPGIRSGVSLGRSAFVRASVDGLVALTPTVLRLDEATVWSPPSVAVSAATSVGWTWR